MARRGNPYDNAVAESLLKTLKTEEVYLWEYETLAERQENQPGFYYRHAFSLRGIKFPGGSPSGEYYESPEGVEEIRKNYSGRGKDYPYIFEANGRRSFFA